MTFLVKDATTDAEEAMMTEAERAFMAFRLRPHTLALIQTGSHAYGTNGPNSDLDYTAIVIPPASFHLGLDEFEHWNWDSDRVDLKVMSLTRFTKLMLEGNPNIIEMLFFEEDQYRFVHKYFQPFLHSRQEFLSRHVFQRFSRYAEGQLKKMQSGQKTGHMGHKRWELVQKLGYDPKDASHLFRLLFTGGELAMRGTLTPRLSGYQLNTVLEIKAGNWSLDRVQESAEIIAAGNDEWFHDPDCPLDAEPNTKVAELLLMNANRQVIP